jgi:hypothetical protein
MAGDWIKMRTDLFTHPKVVRISSALKADALRTVGGLMSVWSLFDAHSIDGHLDGYTSESIDDHLRWPGFAGAMISVCWLEETAQGLGLPEFDTHNGASAKRRAQDADRKREVRKESAPEEDKKRTREEKRRDIPTTNVVGKRGTQLHEGYAPNQQHIDFAGNNALSISEEFAKFSDYHKAKGSTFKDWDAALRTWLRNAVEFAKKHAPAQTKSDKLKTVTDELTGRGNHGQSAITVD